MKQYKFKLILTLLSMIISIVLLVTSFNIEEKNIYTYNIEQQAKYNVYINQNEFINKQYLEANNAYIAGITNYINIQYNYNFNSTDLANLYYKYDVVVTLYIDYTTTNQNLVKLEDYVIKDKFLNLENENKISINENVNIDYNKYNNEVLKFKEKYNLPVTAYLKVDFIVNTTINTDEHEDVKKESSSEINIELNQSVYQINENYEGSGNYQFEEEKEVLPKLLMILGIIIYAISSVYTVILVRSKIITNEKYYEMKLNQILKKYGDIIVELEEPLKLENKTVLKVKDFNELIDVEEEIREPILFYKEAEDIAIFVILDNEIIYEYIY